MLYQKIFFRIFYKIQGVTHYELPAQLARTQMDRPKGVYSKLQAWKLFAPTHRRICMLDTDMLVHSSPDGLFSYRTPAGVMRGHGTSCLFEAILTHTIYPAGWKLGDKLAGGINGGLVLFKPSILEFKRMEPALTWW